MPSDIGQSPTVRRRRLGAELRRLREAAGLTAEEASDKLNELGNPWSKAKMSRLEGAQLRRPNPRDVRDLLDIYGVTDERQRKALEGLAKAARQRGWWTAYDDVLKGAFIGFEAEASKIRTYELAVVPGLLQTPDYLRAILKADGGFKLTSEEIDRRTDVRMKRQQRLERDDAPDLWIVIDENALRRPVGSVETMRAQIDRLIAAAEAPNIDIQVLPPSVGAHAGMPGAFVILDFPDEADPPVVYIETATDSLYLERPWEIESYTLRFDHIRTRAIGAPESIDYMAAIRDQL